MVRKEHFRPEPNEDVSKLDIGVGTSDKKRCVAEMQGKMEKGVK